MVGFVENLYNNCYKNNEREELKRCLFQYINKLISMWMLRGELLIDKYSTS